MVALADLEDPIVQPGRQYACSQQQHDAAEQQVEAGCEHVQASRNDIDHWSHDGPQRPDALAAATPEVETLE
jgi:hypothetical protein